MQVEVDQSGKIGDTKVDTVLAFSNKTDYAILIPAIVKRECLKRLREHGETGKVFYLKLFAIGLYLLLKEYVLSLSTILIDLEYPGREADIKLYLTNLFNRSGIKFNPSSVRFGQVGKKSHAHLKAFRVFTKREKANKRINVKEILKEY
jgi:hypothetical protein